MYFWNEEKNAILKATRGVSFDDVVCEMSQNGILDNYKHPNSEKYPNQYIYVLSLNGYIHYVPYVIDGEDIFLKNIIPSSKLNKKYKG
ncbi:BrnT family toxin [Sulfurovum sp. bin170]|uniref:BrnT family toxin n=1 Tax=Sulfurovum sp. bin170 TaxID=2695268 RepID=UPI0013DF8FA1|nr:BrnT family toxin [Sulfurovum sp. bin170]NEW59970.1 BrnT family toxin [Sulfurovum sp. bin170]